MAEFKKQKLNKQDLEHLRDKYQVVYNMNQRYIDRLIEVTQLTAPLSEGLNVLYGFNDTGARVDRNIYDSTAQYASSVRANNLHSLIWPVGKHWGSVHTLDPQSGQSTYREAETNTAFSFIEESNLHDIAKAYFQDINVGCSAIWVDSPSKEKPLLFKNIVGITIMPEFSDDPENMNCWWHKKISSHELKMINPTFYSKYAEGNQEGAQDEFDIICGYFDCKESHNGYVLVQFLSGVWHTPLSEEWKPYPQLVLTNDNKRAGEARGQGVSMVNLEKIKWINDTARNIKQTIGYFSNPALAMDDRLPNRLNQLRGARIPSALVRDGRAPVMPLIWDYPLNEIAAVLQQEKQELQQIYNINPLGMPNEGPVVSATEIGIRNAEAERQSTADISRISRSSGRVLKIVVEILRHRKIIDIPKDQAVNFKFDSPNVDMQSAEEVNTVLQYGSIMQNVSQQPAFMLYNNQGKFDAWLRDKLKISSSYKATPQETKQTGDMFAKAAQGAQGGQGGQPTAQGGGGFGEAEAVSPTGLGAGQESITGFGM